MILSVSRRTDIPACYADWFFNRLQEGFVLVRNPRNARQISRIALNPETVDGIVFWSKNPAPMLDRLHLLKQYPFYIQFTVTPYEIDIEPNIPDKFKQILPTFRRFSDIVGPKRIIWRYDPVLFNPKYNMEFHLRAFETLTKALQGYTEKCIFSFVDNYKSTLRNHAALSLLDISHEQRRTLGGAFAQIARAYGISLATCAEQNDLWEFGIGHARCVDAQLLESLLGCGLNAKKAQGQRALCGCAESVDIGMYNSCKNGCLYCYANYSLFLMRQNVSAYDPNSPLLCGSMGEGETVRENKARTLKTGQLRLPE